MQPIWISLAACGVMLLGAVIGAVLRRLLPDHHLDDHARDIVRLGAGLVGTIAALVLGLLINSASSSYEAQRGEVRQIAANLILLDAVLDQYGPEAKPIRVMLRETVGQMIDRIWGDPEARDSAGLYGSGTLASRLYAALHALPIGTPAKSALVGEALQLAVSTSQARLALYEQSRSGLPVPTLIVLIFWLTVLFASYCLFSPVNPTSAVALALVALSASAALFLILEMVQPFSGFMQISSESIRAALPPLAP
ncbi:hypothetical protein [Reyranella sp.]|uniref:bestrophin-like domain n=1 Tax=Reyranella sp. TaxID=1929291 RepID=UPI003BABC9DA